MEASPNFRGISRNASVVFGNLRQYSLGNRDPDSVTEKTSKISPVRGDGSIMATNAL